jgi:acyl-CoA synthetase (AMP-forming)/AMP-acid ligase II
VPECAGGRWSSREQSGQIELPDLARLAAGGAPFPADLVAALRARLPRTRLHDVYGLSETHSPACIATDDDLRARPGSVGQPLDCMQAPVRDDDGTVLGPGLPQRPASPYLAHLCGKRRDPQIIPVGAFPPSQCLGSPRWTPTSTPAPQ